MATRPWVLLLALLLAGVGGARAAEHRVRYRGSGREVAPHGSSPGEPGEPGLVRGPRPPPVLEPYAVGGRHWRGSGGAGPERAPWQHGAGPPEPDPVPGELGWWTLGAGSFNVPQRMGVDGFRMEYRTPYRTFGAGRWVAGLSSGPESFLLASLGSYWDIPLWRGWVFTPSLSAAALSGGDEARFGGTLQFRSSLELSYELDASRRVGFAVQHVSNAGLARPNLGCNTQLLTYTQAVGF